MFLDPNVILEELDLRDDMLIAEFGSGSGAFGIALAKRVPKGRVYALDIQEEPLSALRSRAAQQKVFNVETIRCDLEKENGSGLMDNYLDLVIIPNLLFQAKDKDAIILEAKRVVKNKGNIVIIEWLPGSSFGPKEGRIPPSEIKELAVALGLKLRHEFEAGTYHYGLIFSKE